MVLTTKAVLSQSQFCYNGRESVYQFECINSYGVNIYHIPWPYKVLTYNKSWKDDQAFVHIWYNQPFYEVIANKVTSITDVHIHTYICVVMPLHRNYNAAIITYMHTIPIYLTTINNHYHTKLPYEYGSHIQ